MFNNLDYTRLNSKRIASYSIVYRSNYVDGVKHISDLISKDQVRACLFESFYQQNNLVFIDMLFPNVLADIALEVYFNKVFTFDDYIQLPKTYQLYDNERDIKFFKTKIPHFVDHLLYSDIAHDSFSNGTLNHDISYIIDDDVAPMRFNSSNYEDLVQIALSTMMLRIDLQRSYTTNLDEVVLHLVIEFDKGFA